MSENKITLKITEKEKAEIEKELNKTNAIITETISEKNKAIKLNKNAVEIFQQNGVKLEKNYISYNKNMALYNNILAVVKNNSEIFTLNSK